MTLVMGLAHKNHCILPKSYLNSIQAAHENAEPIDIYGAPYETTPYIHVFRPSGQLHVVSLFTKLQERVLNITPYVMA